MESSSGGSCLEVTLLAKDSSLTRVLQVARKLEGARTGGQ